MYITGRNIIALFLIGAGPTINMVNAVGKNKLSWDTWKVKYNKSYLNEEVENRHHALWNQSRDFVNSRNNSKFPFRVELNRYADTHTHYKNKVLKKHKCNAIDSEGQGNSKSHWYDMDKWYMDYSLPKEVDWRKGQNPLVTAVKNQGQCGSCWSFAASGSIEGQYAKKYDKLVQFSESQFVDCDTNGDDEACDGGLPDGAYKYLMNLPAGQNEGLETEKVYPYVPEKENCKYLQQLNPAPTEQSVSNVEKKRHHHKTLAKVSNYVDVNPTENDLKQAVATVGPISVGIDASHQDFQLYKSGVYSNSECSSTTLDHAVLVVGYGTTEPQQGGSDYWIVKNSWGPDWGMNGYVLMSRNNNNNCGIASKASYPVVD